MASENSEIASDVEGHSLDRLVRPVSRALAHAYACGWKQHAQLVGEMQGMTPDEWADANAEMFTQEATDAIWPNK